MPVTVSWPQALAWRMERQLLEPVGRHSGVEVVRRLGGVQALAATPGLGHVADGLRSGWGTLLKPLAWAGELCFGPSRGSHVTFRRPADASTEWKGLPAPEDAAPIAVEAYFGAHGPATLE